jgi:hypothetical protein
VALPVLNAPPCWELVDCNESCGFNKEDCPAFKNQKGHTCWEEMAKRHRRKGDPLPPNCKNCNVYQRKSYTRLAESSDLQEVTV